MAEEGMTWQDWVNSEYNFNSYYINENGEITSNGLYDVRKGVDWRGELVSSSDEIEEGSNYCVY